MSKEMSGLKIAYIVLAHKDPEQFSRLIKRLDSGFSHFYIHIDKKIKIEKFKAALVDISTEKYHFIRQYDGKWGKFGILKAEICAFKAIVKSKIKYDFVISISGQDYPIKNNSYIYNFFLKNKGKNFLNFCSMPVVGWKDGGMYRINRYHFSFLGNDYVYPPYKQPKILKNKILNFLFGIYFKKRIFPLSLKPYVGEHWWSFNLSSVKYILDFLKSNQRYYKFHQYSLCADEMLFHTILLNSSNKDIRKSFINDNLRYIDWTEGNDSPKVLTICDMDFILQSKKLFARKFDRDIDSEILDEIDQRILFK